MTITDYRNFDVLIARAGAGYRAFVVESPAGEGSAFFDLPSAPDWAMRLEGRVGGTTQTQRLAAVGSRLFEAVFQEGLRVLLAASMASAAKEGTGLRIRLRFEEDAADLALLPWETLYDPDQRQFIGLGEGSPILRYLSLPRSRSALLVEPPLRVLAVLSSPADLPKLDLEREWQVVEGALGALAADGKFTLERLASPTLGALQQRLLGEPVHVLHFIGHGVFDETQQAGSLALEDRHGRTQLVRGEDLAKLLCNHPALRLAYLNACQGALGSRQTVLAGVAQALVQGGVPAAVAMQAEISDTGAIDLAHSFYTALAAGRPVDAALTQARAALSATDSDEWAIPALFSRSPDNRLFDLRQVLPTPACPYPGMAPFSEAQQGLFFGRGKEIDEAVERLRQHPFLAVIGPSGSGKSSLMYAGVIPALHRTQRFGVGEWMIKDMRPGPQPLAALAEALGGTAETVSSTVFEQRTLLFVDQFEELFTLAGAEEAQSFLDTLQGLMGRPNLYVLLTVRADFYPDLMACSLWPAIRANRLELPPLGDDELWAAIVEPAARVGVQVDEALAVRLIADAAGERGSLPLVQETLVLLWDKVKERQLGLVAYRGMGEGGRCGLQVAIDRRASSVYDNLPEAAQPIARRIFLRLIQFGEGRADTRRQQTVAELRVSGDDPAVFDATLARLVESRLLTVSGEAGGVVRRVDIAHEALITGWPRLRVWLDERRTAEQTRRWLEAKAAEWVRLGKAGGLLDEYELHDAQTWLTGDDAATTGASQNLADLIAASERALAQAEAERQAQQQRELEQAQRLAEEQRLRAEEGERSSRKLRQLLVVLTIVTGITAIAFATAVWLYGTARTQLDRQAGLARLQEARILKQQGDAQGAIEKLQAARAIQTDLLDFEAEISDVRRQVATRLVQEGEALVRDGDFPAAETKFWAALVLDPPSDTPVYVYVPAGPFRMGVEDLAFPDQSPRHTITLDAYWIQRTEVTNAQYLRCVEAGRCTPPYDGNIRYLEQEFSSLPVTGVTWHQARVYAGWIGAQLPTEAQWEKACRGTDERAYPWGMTPPNPDLSNYWHSGYETWRPVGSYPAGASPYGVLDMAGNVGEWTSSIYEVYPYRPEDGREDETDDKAPRVLRGGSYFSPEFSLHCTYRDKHSPDWGNIWWGFRVVFTP